MVFLRDIFVSAEISLKSYFDFIANPYRLQNNFVFEKELDERMVERINDIKMKSFEIFRNVFRSEIGRKKISFHNSK